MCLIAQPFKLAVRLGDRKVESAAGMVELEVSITIFVISRQFDGSTRPVDPWKPATLSADNLLGYLNEECHLLSQLF